MLRRLASLALVVALAGCAQFGAVWQAIGKVVDAVNLARRVGDSALCAARPDAGTCASSGGEAPVGGGPTPGAGAPEGDAGQ